MYATVRLPVLFSVVALCVATPYYFPQHQQRQLFYSVVPQYSAPVALPAPYRQLYYPPQAAANLVSPVPSALRYSAPLVTPAKQFLYYPGVSPYPGASPYAGVGQYPGQYVLAGDEGSEGGGWASWFTNPFASFIGGSSPASESPATGAAEGGSASEGSAEAKPEKVEQASNSESPAEEENKEKEEEAEKPAEEPKVKGVPQKFVLVGQPQFYGNYGLQRVNPATVLPTANHGAVSSYLLLKNFPGVKFAPAIPQYPQIPQPQQDGDAEFLPPSQAGTAALGYQKLLQAARQQKEYEDAASVTVDAAPKDSTEDDKPSSSVDGDKAPEDEEPGTNE